MTVAWWDDDYADIIVIDGLRYYHVTGFLESMKHRENWEFSRAIRDEKSASLAREMGDDAKILWADLDNGKRPLTESEIRRFERDLPALTERALIAKFSGPLGKLLLESRDVPDRLRGVRAELISRRVSHNRSRDR